MTAPRISAPLIPASWGEVIDKITILEIKSRRIKNDAALSNVRRELDALNQVIEAELAIDDKIADLRDQLSRVNVDLWNIEDEIRVCERSNDFGEEFIRLARSVYHSNDRRAQIKRLINIETSSGLIEEKSYQT